MIYYIILFIKGFFIGIGKIIPGVSGAVLAISLGVYEEAINAVCNFFKNVRNNSKFLLFLGLGGILSVSLVSNFIKFSLNNYYLITMLFFIGLISGGLPNLFKEVFITKVGFKEICFLVGPFLLMLFLTLKYNNDPIILNTDLLSIFIVFGLGVIEAFTMIIPGISGTAIFMLLGTYNIIIDMFSNITNITYIISNLNIVLPFIIGMGIGALVIIKITKYLFDNYKNQTYYMIIGFSVSSIIFLLFQTLNRNYRLIEILMSIVLLILGYITAKSAQKL